MARGIVKEPVQGLYYSSNTPASSMTEMYNVCVTGKLQANNQHYSFAFFFTPSSCSSVFLLLQHLVFICLLWHDRLYTGVSYSRGLGRVNVFGHSMYTPRGSIIWCQIEGWMDKMKAICPRVKKDSGGQKWSLMLPSRHLEVVYHAPYARSDVVLTCRSLYPHKLPDILLRSSSTEV